MSSDITTITKLFLQSGQEIALSDVTEEGKDLINKDFVNTTPEVFEITTRRGATLKLKRGQIVGVLYTKN